MKTGTLRLAFYCTVLFVSGMAVGILSHRYYVQDVVSAKKATQKRGPDFYRHAYMAEMRNRLKLNGDQSTNVEVILDDMRNKFRALRDEQRPRMEQLQTEQTARIRALLTPEQQTEYDLMRVEREAKRKADEARRKAEEHSEKEKRSR